MLVEISQRPYTQFQTAINYTVAIRARRISKNCAFFYCIPGYWNLAAHSGHANRFMPLIRPVIASKDRKETIYWVSECYQLHSGNTDTRNFKKVRLIVQNPGLPDFAAHSGPPNLSMFLITPANASRNASKTIYAVSDCYQLHSGNTGTTNFKKLRLFLLHPGLLEFGGPQRTRKPFHAPYKTCKC